MNLKSLSRKSREEIGHYATKILNRDFDSNDASLFLIYGRAAFKGGQTPTLIEFANTVAHSVRNRDKLFDAAKDARGLTRIDWLTKHEPLGQVGYETASIEAELNAVMQALGLPNVKASAAEDFAACLCVIGNHMEFTDKRGDVIGEANAVAVNHTINLDLTPASGFGGIILLSAPLSALPDGFTDFRDRRIHAVRDAPGLDLRIIEG